MAPPKYYAIDNGLRRANSVPSQPDVGHRLENAVALHLRLMLAALRTGLRRQLGRSFTLVRIGWGSLAASLVLACAVSLDLPWPGTPMLWTLVLVGGWLLSFVLGRGGSSSRMIRSISSQAADRSRSLSNGVLPVSNSYISTPSE